MSENIRSTNLRFNLDKDVQNRAWQYLQTMDKKKFKSYSQIIAISLVDYFDRYYKKQDEPYLETREREERFVEQIVTAVENAMNRTLPVYLAGCMVGIAQITEQLNAVLWPEQRTTVLLETMAGKGSEVGSRFEELRRIIDGVELQDKMGVCLDTCHVYDAGYDIVEHLDDVLDEFDQIIGLQRLKAIHLNDSLNPMGSHKDRHARIGEGHLGLEAICRIINHTKLQSLFFILETPHEKLEGYGEEIALLRGCYQEA